jgi:hypothetical protein
MQTLLFYLPKFVEIVERKRDAGNRHADRWIDG